MKKLVGLVPFFIAPLFIASLAWAQDLPEGEGKKLLQQGCTSCHDLDVVVTQHASKERWQSLVQDMVDRGAPLKEDEVKILIEYLAKSFPPETNK